MMQLYCRCGYPIRVAAHWDGSDIQHVEISLHDGVDADAERAIIACPRCGQSMHLGTLKPRPARTAHWFFRHDEQNDRNDEHTEQTG